MGPRMSPIARTPSRRLLTVVPPPTRRPEITPAKKVEAAKTEATPTKTSPVVNRNIRPGIEAQDTYRQQQIKSLVPTQAAVTPTTPATDEEIAKAKVDSRNVLTPKGANTPYDYDAQRQVVTDAPSPNALNTRPDIDAVKKQTEANKNVVETKLSRMSPEDQARYRDLDKRLGSDADSRLSMQTMLLEDRLTPDTMKELQALDDAPKAQMVEGTRKGRLMRETLREIASPERIEQQGAGTCVPTSATIDLARRDPAEYTRLVRGLASPEGTVVTKSGVELKREINTRTEDGYQRTGSQRLLTPALMEAANGDRLDYDNTKDRHFEPQLDPVTNQPVIDPVTKKPVMIDKGKGLSADPTERAFEILGGRNYDQVKPTEKTPMDQVEEATQRGETVPVGIAMYRDGQRTGAHQVLVTKVYEEDGTKWVEYQNPWGTTERMKKSDMEARYTDSQVAAGA